MRHSVAIEDTLCYGMLHAPYCFIHKPKCLYLCNSICAAVCAVRCAVCMCNELSVCRSILLGWPNSSDSMSPAYCRNDAYSRTACWLHLAGEFRACCLMTFHVTDEETGKGMHVCMCVELFLFAFTCKQLTVVLIVYQRRVCATKLLNLTSTCLHTHTHIHIYLTDITLTQATICCYFN